ncbi:hypothetical protein CBM2599_A160103 [Cupriavidus taiwanensis]|nr:hypothetical protein CBM2599_A160103 [Cupriavidus taiwanensis]SOY84896.1 hypothetical protein CBM2600_A140363 [Cupriavidus taiwanensis]
MYSVFISNDSKHFAILAARMDDEDQAEFAIGMKYAYDAYIRGSLIAHVVQRTKACMSKAELELLV